MTKALIVLYNIDINFKLFFTYIRFILNIIKEVEKCLIHIYIQSFLQILK